MVTDQVESKFTNKKKKIIKKRFIKLTLSAVFVGSGAGHMALFLLSMLLSQQKYIHNLFLLLLFYAFHLSGQIMWNIIINNNNKWRCAHIYHVVWLLVLLYLCSDYFHANFFVFFLVTNELQIQRKETKLLFWRMLEKCYQNMFCIPLLCRCVLISRNVIVSRIASGGHMNGRADKWLTNLEWQMFRSGSTHFAASRYQNRMENMPLIWIPKLKIGSFWLIARFKIGAKIKLAFIFSFFCSLTFSLFAHFAIIASLFRPNDGNNISNMETANAKRNVIHIHVKTCYLEIKCLMPYIYIYI